MATTKAIIDVSINTGAAAAQLRSLQDQINSFNATLNKNNLVSAQASRQLADQLMQAVNSSRAFTAEQVRMETAARRLDQTLVKGKGTLGQYFSAKFKKDGAEAAAVLSLANARAQALQTQFVKLSGAAGGFRDALAIRPLQALNDSMEVANQKAAIHSAMFRQATTSMINFGKNTQWAGRQLMVGFTVPMTIFGAAAGKTFKEIEQAAVRFKKVYGDAFTTPAEIEKNMKAVEGLALEFTKYGIAVKDTIGLAAEAAAAGAQNADLIAATTEATRLATLGQMEQQEALTATIALQNAFKLSSQDLAKEVNFLNMVENQTVVTLQDLAEAIPRVAPVIVGLGGDVRDMAAMLAAMQEGGVSAAQGANALKSGLGSLINPTNKASKVLAEMGININAIVQANRGDLMGTVTAFAQALSGLDKFTRQQALEELFGKYQYARLGALFENIIKDGTQASRVLQIAGLSAEQMAKSAERELSVISEATSTKYLAAMERFKLAIAPVGEMFMKISTPIINFFAKLFEMFDKLPEGAKTFSAFAALIVGVVVPAGTMFLGLLMNLIGTLAKFGHIIGVAMKGFGKGGFGGAIQAVSQSLRYMGLQEIDAANAAQQLGLSTGIANEALLNQVTAAGNARVAIDRLSDAYAKLISTQIGFAEQHPMAFGVAGTAGATAAGRPPRAQRRNRGGKIRYMSGGGSTVPGFGNTDTVPAMLTPGEFVVNKQATQQNLPLLHAINDGMKMPGFNKGGRIPRAQYFGVRPGSRGGGNVGYGSYVPKSDLDELMAADASALAAFGPYIPRQSGIMAGERGLIPYRSLAETDPKILKLISTRMQERFGVPVLTSLGTNVGVASKTVAERVNRDLMGDRASVSELRALTEMVDYYQTTFAQVPAARAALTALGMTPLGASEAMARVLPEKLKRVQSVSIGDRALWDITREAYQDAGLLPLFDALEGQRGAIRYALPQHISSGLRFGVEKGSSLHGKALADVFGTENVQFTRRGKKPVYVIKGSALGSPYDVGISPGLTEDFPALGYSYQSIAKDIAGMVRIHMGAPQALNKGGVAGVQYLQYGGILKELAHLDDDLNIPESALIDFYNLSTTKDVKAKNAFVASYPRWINQTSRAGSLRKQDFINYLLNESTIDDYKLLFDEMQIPESDREKIHRQINDRIIRDLNELPGDIISDNGLNNSIKFSNVGNSFYSATPNKYKERLKQIRETVAEVREKRASGRGTSRRFRKTSDLAIIKAMASIAKRKSPELIGNAPAIWQVMRAGLRRNSGGAIPNVQYFANAGIVQRLMRSGLQRGQLQRKLEMDNQWKSMSEDLRSQVIQWDTGRKPTALITGRIGEMIKSGKSFDIVEQALGLPSQRTSSLAGPASREQLKTWLSRFTGQNPIAEYNDLINMYRNNPMSNEDRQWFLSEVLAPAFDRRESVLGLNSGGLIQHLVGGGPAVSGTLRRLSSKMFAKSAAQKLQKYGFNALSDEEKLALRGAAKDVGNMPLFKGTSLLSSDIDQSIKDAILNGRESDLIGKTIATPFGSYSTDEAISRPFILDNNEMRRVQSLKSELFPSMLSIKDGGKFRKPKTGKEALIARMDQVGQLPLHLMRPGMSEDEKRAAWFKWMGIDERVWNAGTQRLERAAQEYDDLMSKGAGKGIIYRLRPSTAAMPSGQSRIVDISTSGGVTTITLETGKTFATPVSQLGGAPVMPGGKEKLNPENEWHIQQFANGGMARDLQRFAKGNIFQSANRTIVPGVGSRDTVPAALTPGEFVVNKKATAQNLGLLKAINNGAMVRANKGGLLGIQYLQQGAITLGPQNQMLNLGQVGPTSPLPVNISEVDGQDPAKTNMGADAKDQRRGGMGRGFAISTGLGTLGGAMMMAPMIPAVGQNQQLSGGLATAGTIVSSLSMLAMLPPQVAAVAAGFIALGGTIAAIVMGANDLRNSLSNMNKAVNGSTENVKLMGQAFGRQTAVEQVALMRAQAVGGGITQEAYQAAGEFVQGEAGAKLIEDLKLVQKMGKDQNQALINQLSRSILAGAITPEEARSIAIQIGNALGNQKIGMQVSAQITEMFGQDGEKIKNNRLKIATDLLTEIDKETLMRDAEQAAKEIGKVDWSKGFDLAAAGATILTLGGNFVTEQQTIAASLQAISDASYEAAMIEKEQRAAVTLEYQQGIITLDQYKQKLDEINQVNISGTTFNRGLAAYAQVTGIPQEQLMAYSGETGPGAMGTALNVATSGAMGGFLPGYFLAPVAREMGIMPDFENLFLTEAETFGKQFVQQSVDSIMKMLQESGYTEMEQTMLRDMAGTLGGAGTVQSAKIFQGLAMGDFSPQVIQVLSDLNKSGGLANLIPPDIQDKTKYLKELGNQLNTFIAYPDLQTKMIELLVKDPKEGQKTLDQYEEIFMRAEILPDDVKKRFNIDISTTGGLDQASNILPKIETLMPLLDRLQGEERTLSLNMALDENGKVISGNQFMKNLDLIRKTLKNIDIKKGKARLESIIEYRSMLVDETGKTITNEEARGRLDSLISELGLDQAKLINLPTTVIKQILDFDVELKDAQNYLRALQARRIFEAKSGIDTAATDAEINATMALIGGIKQDISAAYKTTPQKEKVNVGGGGGAKSILQQLKDQFKQLQDIYNGMARFINSKTGLFKGIAAGPFGPQFIEFLKQQGEEGIKILNGNLAKFKQVYNEFVKVQRQNLKNTMQALPSMLRTQANQVLGTRQLTNMFEQQGISPQNIENILSLIGDANIQEFGRISRKKNKTGEERAWVQSFRKSLPNIIREAGLISQENRTTLIENMQDTNKLQSSLRELLSGRGLSPEVIDTLVEMGFTLQDVKKNFADVIEKAKQLDVAMKEAKYNDAMKSMATETEMLNRAIGFIAQGIDADLANAMANAGLSTASATQEFQNAYNELKKLQMAAQDPIELRIQLMDVQESIADLRSRIAIEEQLSDEKALLKEYERQNDELSRRIELRQRDLEPIDEQIAALEEQKTTANEYYDKQIEYLNEVYQKEQDINEIRRGQMDIASALSRGDVAGAAQAAMQMQQQMAQRRQENSLQAIEKARQQDIEAIDANINTLKEQRKVIENDIKNLQKQQRDIQDQIYNLNKFINAETERLGDLYKIANSELERMRLQLEQQLRLEGQILAALEAQASLRASMAGNIGGGRITPSTNMSQSEFDAYIQQTALDNAAAAGFPGLQLSNLSGAALEAEIAKGQQTVFGGPLNLGNLSLPGFGMAFGGSVKYRGSREPAPGMAFGGKVKKFAIGNIVPGRGMTDKVPALLTPGEFVVRKSVAQTMLPQLKDMNSQVYPSIPTRYRSNGIDGLVYVKDMATFNPFTDMSSISSNPIIDSSRVNMNTFPVVNALTNQVIPNYNSVTVSKDRINNNNQMQYNYNVNVYAETNANADDIANQVVYKIRRNDQRQIRGTRV